MESINSTAHLSRKNAECFITSLVATSVETKLRYYCVARGIWDTKGKEMLRDVDNFETADHLHYLGEADYNFNEVDGGRPAYLQKIKKELKNRKTSEDAAEQLDFWNNEQGMGSPL